MHEDAGLEILLEDISPSGSVKAIVEAGESAVWFYLGGADDTDFGVRALWIANLAPAPDHLDEAAMETGGAAGGVMMPAQACDHPLGRVRPEPDALSVSWFPEGDGAMLWENGELLAVIPGWSGVEGFRGYARHCSSPSPLATPLGTENEPFDEAIFARIAEAERFWQWCDTNPWDELRDGLLGAYEKIYDGHEGYWTIDGGYWPPRGLLKFLPEEAGPTYLTLGMSIRPMPRADEASEQPRQVRRVELGLAVGPETELDEQAVLNYLCAHANLPWERIAFLGHGHVLGATGLFKGSSLAGKFPAALLCRELDDGAKLDLPDLMNDPVGLLWIVPITKEELEWAEASGTDALIEELRRAGVTSRFSARPSVA